MERPQPGAPLGTAEGDERATSAAVDVLRRLRRPAPAPAGRPFSTVPDQARGLARLRRHFGGGTGPLPTALVE